MSAHYLDTLFLPAPAWSNFGSGHVGEAFGNTAAVNHAALTAVTSY